MDDLFQVSEETEEPGFNDELLFVDEEPEEDGADQPAAQATAANPDLEVMRREIENLNKRLQDTQSSFHQANQGRQFAEEIIRANREEAAAEQRRRAAAAAMAPPQLSDEEIEALHSDPRAIVQTVQNYGEYVRQRTLAEVGPYIARLDRAARLSEAMVEREILRAEQDAKQMAAVQWDIDEAEYQQLAPYADNLLQQAAKDPDSYKAMRLNPGIIATALATAKTQMQGGVRVNKPAVAPSFGGGGGGDRGSRQGVQKLPGRLVSTASKMERKLGLDSGSIANAPVRTRQQGRL